VTDIIFEYEIPDTNWLNPDWRRYEGKRFAEMRTEEELRVVDMLNPCATNQEKADIVGVSYTYYMQLRKKYNLDLEGGGSRSIR